MDSFKRVNVDRDVLNQEPRKENIAGVLVDVFFSPYDMPATIEGGYDESKKRFVIKFNYLNADEPTNFEERNEDVVLSIGKHSRRLYEVELDVDNMGANQVALNVQKVEEVIKKYAEESKTDRSKYLALDNYLAASNALHTSSQDLVRELSTAE